MCVNVPHLELAHGVNVCACAQVELGLLLHDAMHPDVLVEVGGPGQWGSHQPSEQLLKVR